MEEVNLLPGFNIIVGKNNVGKTALAEAISLQFADNAHRSLLTVPTSSAAPNPISEVHMALQVDKEELLELLKYSLRTFYMPAANDRAADSQAQEFLAAISDQITIRATYASGDIRLASLEEYGDRDSDLVLYFTMEDSDEMPKFTGSNKMSGAGSVMFLPMQLANVLRGRIYYFKAERLSVAETSIGYDPILAPDASNLAQCLHILQSNPARFDRLNELVNTIFPDVKQITVGFQPTGTVRVLVWPIDPISEREDLAVPLSESGTGIGQVLAILYVVLTSEYPRAIILDEPQSFLHPGAVRKLLDILRHYQRQQHQYVIATHSPTVITASDPQTLLLVRKEAAESIVDQLDVEESQHQRLFLSEIGARLSDVFGADNILWVEGRTEEQCFPLILSRLAERPLLGTAIIGVVQTGDFESRQSSTILEIYRRLSEGRGLLPPAIGFIFDKEGRSDEERNDLIRQSGGTVFFTPRRMYENYLLNPRAIASLASSIEGFRDGPVTVEEVEGWLQRHSWESKYFAEEIREADRGDELWLQNVHGANVLKDIFEELSDSRATFDKVRHGVALTEWLVEYEPENLAEVVELLERVLPQLETP
jgi:predicted ATPase